MTKKILLLTIIVAIAVLYAGCVAIGSVAPLVEVIESGSAATNSGSAGIAVSSDVINGFDEFWAAYNDSNISADSIDLNVEVWAIAELYSPAVYDSITSGMNISDFMATAKGAAVVKVVEEEIFNVKELIKDKGLDLEYKYDYSVLFSGFAVRASLSELLILMDMEEIKDIHVTAEYDMQTVSPMWR
ncbi:MAG: hypothetical protein PHX51_02605 [Clostridia bacterium]|nr:hypothetical protein [Clostridia bacterium]